MSDIFLTRAEVAELTGYRQRGKQCDFLRRAGWPFEVGADKHPRVLRAETVRRLSAPDAPSQPAPRLRFD